MKVCYTNFDGDWDSACPHCGELQRAHQVDLGFFDGMQCIHRQPCPEEQHEIRKRAVSQGIVIRAILVTHDIANYLWGLIPFKAEVQLFFSTAKHLFISIRAMLFLRRANPGRKNDDSEERE